MSRTFGPESQAIFKLVGFVLAALGAIAVLATWYYATPKYTRVGYAPDQPIPFSHELHAGQLGMDCTHCHTHVGSSPHANVPSTQTCLNCHGATLGNIRADSRALAPLREAERTGAPIPWVQVHRLPDYAYFNHAVHVRRGVSCVSCHGKVNEMEVVVHAKSLSMSWCLDCHRDPGPHLRPNDEVTNLDWVASADPRTKDDPAQWLAALQARADIVPPQSCSGCHR